MAEQRPFLVKCFTELSRTARYFPEEIEYQPAMALALGIMPFIVPHLDSWIINKGHGQRITYPIFANKDVGNLHSTELLPRYKDGHGLSVECKALWLFARGLLTQPDPQPEEVFIALARSSRTLLTSDELLVGQAA